MQATSGPATGTTGAGASGSGGGGSRRGGTSTQLTVRITNPAPGMRFGQGTPIAFSGEANDRNGRDLTNNIRWQWDGQKAKGGSFSTELPPGEHHVRASVANKRGESVSDEITVSVEARSPF